MAVIHTERVKNKKIKDAAEITDDVAKKLGVDAFGPNQTHYINTSETDDGLLVEVHEVDPGSV